MSICGEQPGGSHFEEDVELASIGGALFNFSRWSVKEYARRDIRAERFQLGYSPLWDHTDRHGPGTSTSSSWAASQSDARGRWLARTTALALAEPARAD